MDKNGESKEAKVFAEEILTEKFFKENWSKKPIKFCADELKNNPFKPFDFMTIDELQKMLLFAEDNLKMFKESTVFMCDNLFIAYLEGASLIVNQADRLHTRLYNLCRYLSAKFFHHTFAVAYLTPPGTHAVRAHTDDQDTFIIQLLGKKIWSIYAPPIKLPYTQEMLGKFEPINPKLLEDVVMACELNAGDVLHMPRGFIHQAKTTSVEPSFHITITVPTSDYTWGACLERLFREMTIKHEVPQNVEMFLRTPLLRKGVKGGLEDEKAKINLEEALKCLAEKTSPSRIRESLEGHLSKIDAKQEEDYKEKVFDIESHRLALSFNDTIMLQPGIKCECTIGSEVATFFRGSQTLSINIYASDSRLLVKLADGQPVVVKDLPSDDPFESICVCRTLLKKKIIDILRK